MDFGVVLYLCPPDSSDTYMLPTDMTKKFAMFANNTQVSFEMSDT